MAKTLTHTCLPASPALQAAGFSVVVALEHDRVPLAAFKLGKDASAWCDERNGIAPAKPAGMAIGQSVGATVTPGRVAGTPKPH